jgi:hypothetical protein
LKRGDDTAAARVIVAEVGVPLLQGPISQSLAFVDSASCDLRIDIEL